MAKDMRAVIFNEKIKRISTVLGGGSLALLATAFVRLNEPGAALTGVGWLFLSAIAMLVAVQINELLDSEDAS